MGDKHFKKNMAENTPTETDVIFGTLYCYDVAHEIAGNPIIKVGCTRNGGNSRIDKEMKETLSAGKEAILRANNDNIPICFIQVPRKKSICKMEKELFDKIQKLGAKRAHGDKKELFINISVKQIVECMETMINDYGGRMTKYEKTNFLTSDFDDYVIDYGDHYNKNCNNLIINRVKQFIGKRIRDIRDPEKETLKKNTFQFGGSPNKQRFCNKADFDYIIKDTNRIKLVEQ